MLIVELIRRGRGLNDDVTVTLSIVGILTQTRSAIF